MARSLVNRWYDEDLFSAEIKLAQRHKDIEGVDEVSARIAIAQKQYMEELKTLWNDNESTLDNCNDIWVSWEAKKKKCKWGLLASIVAYFIFGYCTGLNSYTLSAIFYVLYNLAGLAVPVFIVAWIVSKVVEGRKWDGYYSYEKSLTSRANAITRKYLSVADSLYKEIDDLYLATLDPAHREAVLTRRDQERHHQELLREQRQHQERVEAEQREILRTQQRLLEIEEEKERRRRGY